MKSVISQLKPLYQFSRDGVGHTCGLPPWEELSVGDQPTHSQKPVEANFGHDARLDGVRHGLRSYLIELEEQHLLRDCVLEPASIVEHR